MINLGQVRAAVVAVACAATLSALLASDASANTVPCTTYYNDQGGHLWTDPANWGDVNSSGNWVHTGHVPGSGDYACGYGGATAVIPAHRSVRVMGFWMTKRIEVGVGSSLTFTGTAYPSGVGFCACRGVVAVDPGASFTVPVHATFVSQSGFVSLIGTGSTFLNRGTSYFHTLCAGAGSLLDNYATIGNVGSWASFAHQGDPDGCDGTTGAGAGTVRNEATGQIVDGASYTTPAGFPFPAQITPAYGSITDLTIDNAGTIDSNSDPHLDFNDIALDSDRLTLESTGVLRATSGEAIDLRHNLPSVPESLTYQDGATLTGPGTIAESGGSWRPAVSAATLHLTGTYELDSSAAVSEFGPGSRLSVDTGGTLNAAGGGGALNGATVINHARVNFTFDCMEHGARVENTAGAVLTADGSGPQPCSASDPNPGVITNDQGARITVDPGSNGTLQMKLNNAGTITVPTGSQLTVRPGSASTNPDTLASTSVLSTTGTGVLPITFGAGGVLPTVTYQDGARVSGSGVQFVDGTLTPASPGAALHIDGVAAVTGGSWTFATGAKVIVGPAGTLRMGNATLDGATVVNHGRLDTNASACLQHSATIENAATMTIDATAIYDCSASDSSPGTVLNDSGATLTAANLHSSDSSTIDPPFENRGSVVIHTGSLRFNGGATNQAQGRITATGGGNVYTNGLFTNRGTLALGARDRLQATTFTQTTGAKLALSIATTSSSTIAGNILANAATLAGTLALSGPLATAGTAITIISGGPVSGTFATVSPNPGYQVGYGPSDVTLRVPARR